MVLTTRQRRIFTYLLSTVLLLGQLAGFIANPRPAAAALSADPNAEIVYIDDEGVIRVFDTQGDPLVQWFSPDGGWDQIVLLDVTNDGDMEILALDQQGGDNARVTIFDPVLARGATDPNKQINGIPWDILFTTHISGDAQYIVAGDFDQNIPGDEWAVGFMHGSTSIVQVWNADDRDPSTGAPTGRNWKVHIQKEYPDIEYTFGISGQLNGEGADELILFDPESELTRMDIYRPDQDMFLTDEETSSNDRFKFGAAGQLIEGGREELVAILTVSSPNRPSLRSYEMGDDGELEEDLRLAFTPQPEWVFLADIRGNGDKEVLFLRNYPEGQEGPRLILRDDWGDDQRQNNGLIEWALMDDGANNEFRAGVGADIDGDGRDEIILLRNDRLRIFDRPETGNEDHYSDHFFDTDNRRINLLAGDLDRIGFSTGPILLVSGNMIDAILPAGVVSEEFVVSVANIGPGGGIGISAIIPPADQSWAKVDPVFGTTPVNFRVRFDTTSLNPGVYNTTMTLVANQSNVHNNNYVVYLNLTVVPPILQADPPILNIFRFPCENDPCSDEEIAERNEPFTATVHIDGTTDLAFRAAILGAPPRTEGVTSASVEGLAGPITGGKVDENGNIVIYDDFGNSRTLGPEITAAQATTPTLLLDPSLTWVTSATLDSGVVPATLSLRIDPSILTEDYQREFAVIVLVADTRAGTPSSNVFLVPVQIANIGHIMWAGYILKE